MMTWELGDGQTSTEQEGLYTVSLSVEDANGDDNTENKINYIPVTGEGIRK